MPEANAKFRIEIRSSKLKESDTIISWLPEELDLSVESEWSTPLAGGASSELGALLSTINASAVAQWMTVAVWSGSSPIVMTLPLQFVAEDEGEADSKVITPIRNLMKLALPSLASDDKEKWNNKFGILSPPGPNPAGQTGEQFEHFLGWGAGSENINIKIGNFMEFKKIIVLRVNPVFSTLLDKNGLPMRANVSFTFRTYNSPLKSDMNGIIKSNVRSLR